MKSCTAASLACHALFRHDLHPFSGVKGDIRHELRPNPVPAVAMLLIRRLGDYRFHRRCGDAEADSVEMDPA